VPHARTASSIHLYTAPSLFGVRYTLPSVVRWRRWRRVCLHALENRLRITEKAPYHHTAMRAAKPALYRPLAGRFFSAGTLVCSLTAMRLNFFCSVWWHLFAALRTAGSAKAAGGLRLPFRAWAVAQLRWHIATCAGFRRVLRTLLICWRACSACPRRQRLSRPRSRTANAWLPYLAGGDARSAAFRGCLGACAFSTGRDLSACCRRAFKRACTVAGGGRRAWRGCACSCSLLCLHALACNASLCNATPSGLFSTDIALVRGLRCSYLKHSCNIHPCTSCSPTAHRRTFLEL